MSDTENSDGGGIQKSAGAEAPVEKSWMDELGFNTAAATVSPASCHLVLTSVIFS